MASVRVLDRIELNRYLIPLRTIAENPEFRTTQKSLEFELNEQRSAREETAWIAESILPQHQHILDDLQDIQDQIEENEAGVEYLMGITEMEHLYSNVSALTATRACQLAMKGMEMPYAAHDMRFEVDLCWDNVQKYAELSNIHLKNAAEYHCFYYHTKQLHSKICRVSDQVDAMFDRDNWEGCDGTPIEARHLANVLRSTLIQFEQFARESERLSSQAHTIVPIYMRTQPLLDEVDGIMLCDYDMGDFKFRAGDRIVIMSNRVPVTTVYASEYSSEGISSGTEIHADRTRSGETNGGSTETVEIIDTSSPPPLTSANAHRPYSIFDSSSDPSGFTENGTVVSHYWRVRGINETAVRVVPSVCVWITSPATDAINTADKLKEELLVNWNDTIDRLLQVVCNFMRQFLNRIIDSDGISVADEAALQRLFTLLDESYPRYPSGIYNTEIATLLDTVNELRRETRRGECQSNPIFTLKRTEIQQYINVIELLQMHMHKSRKFETHYNSLMEWHETQQRIVQEAHRMMFAVDTIHEISRLDLQKVQQIVVELRRLNRIHWEHTISSSVTETEVIDTSQSVTMESMYDEEEPSTTSSMTIESRNLREIYDRKYSLNEMEEQRLEYLRQRKRLNQIEIKRTLDLSALLSRPREMLQRYTTTTNIQMRPSTDRYNIVYVEVNPQCSDTDKALESRKETDTQTDVTNKMDRAEISIQNEWKKAVLISNISETVISEEEKETDTLVKQKETTDSVLASCSSEIHSINDSVQLDISHMLTDKTSPIHVSSVESSEKGLKLIKSAVTEFQTIIEKTLKDQTTQTEDRMEWQMCTKKNKYTIRGTQIKPLVKKSKSANDLVTHTTEETGIQKQTEYEQYAAAAAHRQMENRRKQYQERSTEIQWMKMKQTLHRHEKKNKYTQTQEQYRKQQHPQRQQTRNAEAEQQNNATKQSEETEHKKESTQNKMEQIAKTYEIASKSSKRQKKHTKETTTQTMEQKTHDKKKSENNTSTQTSGKSTPTKITITELRTNTAYIQKLKQQNTQTTMTNLLQQSVQFHKQKPTTQTENTQTTPEPTNTVCQNNTQYITSTPITTIKQTQTKPTTKFVTASTQHTIKQIQTPIVEVTTQMTQHAEPIKLLQAKSETKTLTIPELRTNTAYIQKLKQQNTQTTMTNLLQQSVQFHKQKPTTQTMDTQTDGATGSVTAATHLPLNVFHSSSTSPTQFLPVFPASVLLVESCECHSFCFVDFSSQFPVHAFTPPSFNFVSTVVSLVPPLCLESFGSSVVVISDTVYPSVSRSPPVGFSPVPSGFPLTGDFPQASPNRSIYCDDSGWFSSKGRSFVSSLFVPAMDIQHIPLSNDVGNQCFVAPKDSVYERPHWWRVSDISVQCDFTTLMSPQVDDLLGYMNPDLTDSVAISSTDFESHVFVIRDLRKSVRTTRSRSMGQPLHSSASSFGSISHTQTSFEKLPLHDEKQYISRDVGIGVTPIHVQRADVGVAVNLLPVREPTLSSRDLYNFQYRLGRIAESQVAVCPTTCFAQIQTDDLQLIMPETSMARSIRTQTDLVDWDMSESTTKLHPTVFEIRGDSTEEEVTQSVDYRSQDVTCDQSGLLVTETFSAEQSSKDFYRQAIRCRVRQRTAQYELLEARRANHVSWFDSIREVASPITGLFAPVGTAVRAGWLELGDRNLYVNPQTGQTIPLETAVQRGLVRLRQTDSESDPYDSDNAPNLLLIERISFSWRPVRITSFVDTRDGRQYTIEEALKSGWIDISTGEPLIRDRETDAWVSTEEATGRGMIQIEPIESDESDSSLLEETYSCRVFRIVSVRPGGEPSDWLEPSEAARIGLFNWQTGEVATEWQARPEFPQTDTGDGEPCARHPLRFVPTGWCSLLTARKARWLRLQAELHPMDWITSMPMDEQTHLGHRILATHVHLVAPSKIPVDSPSTTDQPSRLPMESRSEEIMSDSFESSDQATSYIEIPHRHHHRHHNYYHRHSSQVDRYPRCTHHRHHAHSCINLRVNKALIILRPSSPSTFSISNDATRGILSPISKVDLTHERHRFTSMHTVIEKENTETTGTMNTTSNSSYMHRSVEVLADEESDRVQEEPTEIELSTMNWRRRSVATHSPSSHKWFDRYSSHRAQSDAAMEQSSSSAYYSRYESFRDHHTATKYAEHTDHHRMYRSEQFLHFHEESEHAYKPTIFQHWEDDTEPMI